MNQAIDIRQLDLHSDDLEDFFSESNDPSLLGYHHPTYLKIIDEIISCQSGYIAAYENKRLMGLLPYSIKEGEYGSVVNAMPFFGVNGTLAVRDIDADSTVSIRQQILKSFYELRSSSCAFYSPFCTPIDENWINDFKPDFRIRKFTLSTTLQNPHVWPKKRLADIKRARDYGFKLRQGTIDDLESLWQLYYENCLTVGIPLKPKQFLQRTLQLANSEGPILWWVAEKDNNIGGALLTMKGPRTLSYNMPIANSQLRQYQANALLIDHVVQSNIGEGIKYFNFESSPKRNDPVYLYKKRWGAEESLYEIWGKFYSQSIKDAEESGVRERYPYFFVKPFMHITGTI